MDWVGFDYDCLWDKEEERRLWDGLRSRRGTRGRPQLSSHCHSGAHRDHAMQCSWLQRPEHLPRSQLQSGALVPLGKSWHRVEYSLLGRTNLNVVKSLLFASFQPLVLSASLQMLLSLVVSHSMLETPQPELSQVEVAGLT